MIQSNDKLWLIAATLQHINQHLTSSSIDTEHYAMALQAVQTDDPVSRSRSVIQAVIAAFFRESLIAADTSEQMDMLILMPELELIHYKELSLMGNSIRTTSNTTISSTYQIFSGSSDDSLSIVKKNQYQLILLPLLVRGIK